MSIRVLFVDDDPNILNGLRRMLHSRRKEWDMTFVGSGEEALSTMEIKPIDLVITDMKMPRMNGAELLAEVKKRSPRTIRIVLSGYSNREAAMLSVTVSHQFLSKPLAANALSDVVSRARDLSQFVPDPDIQLVLGSLVELPMDPNAHEELKVAVSKADTDIDKMCKIVERDAALSAKLLQLINSSYFGISDPTTDVCQAIADVGLRTLRQLVQEYSMFQPIEPAANATGDSLEQMRRDSHLAARIARRITRNEEYSDEAYLAALLHGVGRLILATKFKEHYETILRVNAESGRPLFDIEKEVLGANHAEIGAYLLGLWGLPLSIVEAVAYHQQPALVRRQTSFGVLGAAHAAYALAHEQDSVSGESFELDMDYLTVLGVAGRVPKWRVIAEEEASSAA